jgi:hypothetical protein
MCSRIEGSAQVVELRFLFVLSGAFSLLCVKQINISILARQDAAAMMPDDLRMEP